MTVTRKWIGILCFGVLGGLSAAPLLAQSAVEQPTGERARQVTPGALPRTTSQTVPATADQSQAHLNKQIAVCLTLGNEAEVALAEFSEQRTQNPEVKRFAQQMIEQHRQAVSKIQQAAPETVGLNLQLGSQAAGTASTPTSGVRQASAEEPIASNNAAHDQRVVQMVKQIAQECLNLTQQELAQKEGAEFDKAYIGQQVGAHLGMLAQLRGSKNFASGELQQVISEGEQATQKHLAEAKRIKSQLMEQRGAQPPQTSQRPATPTQPTR
jgi:predicted outer membrane protein